MSTSIGNTALAYAKVWHQVDAKGQVLGRLSTQIAKTLMGKHKPIYNPASDCGDYVVVINAKQIEISGRKRTQKLYRHHTGHPGGLKEIPFNIMMENKPEKVIERAVSGMLPKNRLRKKMMSRLFIFTDNDHPYVKNIYTQYDNKIPLPPQAIAASESKD